MSVQFFLSRTPEDPPLCEFGASELDLVNGALRNANVPWEIDPYGDSKLTDANLEQIIAAVGAQAPVTLSQKLAVLSRHHCVYGFGE